MLSAEYCLAAAFPEGHVLQDIRSKSYQLQQQHLTDLKFALERPAQVF